MAYSNNLIRIPVPSKNNVDMTSYPSSTQPHASQESHMRLLPVSPNVTYRDTISSYVPHPRRALCGGTITVMGVA